MSLSLTLRLPRGTVGWTCVSGRYCLQTRKELGFGSLGLEESDFLEPDQVVQLGYPPNRIDLLASLPRVDFDRCYQRRIPVDVGGTEAVFIERNDLICNKLASACPQDLADVENLG